MKTQTHTPGPWHVGMKPGPIIYGGKGEQIADLRAHWLEDREHVENVRLIASAPELLNSLQSLLEMVTDNRLHGNEVYQASNTIAKALGRI